MENDNFLNFNEPNTIEEEIDSSEVQKTLFESWIKTNVLLYKRRAYTIPAKIIELSCGCKRARTHEGDVNNKWVLTRKSSTYTHKECGKQIILP